MPGSRFGSCAITRIWVLCGTSVRPTTLSGQKSMTSQRTTSVTINPKVRLPLESQPKAERRGSAGQRRDGMSMTRYPNEDGNADAPSFNRFQHHTNYLQSIYLYDHHHDSQVFSNIWKRLRSWKGQPCPSTRLMVQIVGSWASKYADTRPLIHL